MKHVYLTWHELEELVSKLIFKLNTPYDAILVITRGGIILAAWSLKRLR